MGRPHDPPGSISIHGRIVNFYSQMLLFTTTSLVEPRVRLPGKPADAPGTSTGARFVSEPQANEERDCFSIGERRL